MGHHYDISYLLSLLVNLNSRSSRAPAILYQEDVIIQATPQPTAFPAGQDHDASYMNTTLANGFFLRIRTFARVLQEDLALRPQEEIAFGRNEETALHDGEQEPSETGLRQHSRSR